MGQEKIDLCKVLNPAQFEAAVTLGVPLLVIAGAGSGKTRVITYRIVYLLQRGVMPQNVLAVTFTNKAAGEMRARIDKYIGSSASLSIGTFHSVCVRILRAEVCSIGLGPNFVIYDENDRMSLIKEVCKELNIKPDVCRPKDAQNAISAAKNRLITADKFKHSAYDPYTRMTAEIYYSYEKKMRRYNAVDFDDIILHTVSIFERYPRILRKYREMFRHILVDEYQDTNYAQYRLVNLLAAGGSGLCVVGDPDQSIYSWRGADITNILRFEKDYRNARVVRLERNYRSTQNILSAANSVIKNNARRKDKDLWTDREDGYPVYIYNAGTELDEAEFTAGRIQELLESECISYSDMVIFYRTHAQSRVFEDALRFHNIPYEIVGGIGFYERREVKDIVAYLRLIVYPGDLISLKRIINVPGRGIGKTSMKIISETAKKHKKTFTDIVWDTAHKDCLPPNILRKVRPFALMMEGLRKVAGGLSLAGLVRRIVRKTGYMDSLKKEKNPEAVSRLENIEELASAARDFEDSGCGSSLSEFLSGISLLSGIDMWKDEKDKVTLMTLHSAKGLEFEAVFMTGMEDSLFPHYSASFDNNELEEERRLCYVGMTRAKKMLIMSCAQNRMIFGARRYCVPSRFLSEIPYNLKAADVSEDICGGSIPAAGRMYY